MSKIISLILFGLISQITFAQGTYKNLIKIRFVDDYESHYSGDIRGRETDTTSIERYDHKPAFDPIPQDYNKDSIFQIISKELDKYPLEVIKLSRLVEIVICDGVYFNDENHEPNIRASGTYIYPPDIGNVIFIDGYSKALPHTLHHEFSSVLFLQVIDYDSLFWPKYLETENYFKKHTNYIEDSPDFQNGGISNSKWWLYPDNTDNKLVLRTDGYALTAFENDYNSIAGVLFAPENGRLTGNMLIENDKDLWEFLELAETEQYPIFDKVMKVINLYNHINPIFTVSYFKELETSHKLN